MAHETPLRGIDYAGVTVFRLPVLDATPVWVASERPPPLVCPRRYCFNFVEAGNLLAPGRHASLDDAVDRLSTVTEDYCSGSFGRCKRGGLGGDTDWYEPCEPVLERDGLPWFYFIAGIDNLVEELRERFLTESAALWGP
jgi:hypothetical protein